MGFGSMLADAVKGMVDGAKEAAKAVVKPVAEAVGGVVGTVVAELTELAYGLFGSPIPPNGTNWNAYTHQQMQKMLQEKANPGQVGEQSSVLDDRGRSARDCATEIGREHGKVPEFWRGKASSGFGTVLDEYRTGVTAHAEHAATLGLAVAKAAEALARAQREMPPPVDVDSATKKGAAAGGVFGGLLGGGAGGALGLAAGAGASWFGSSLLAANKKAEAVAVMQRFEQTLQGAALPARPTPVPPDPARREDPEPPRPPIPGPDGRTPNVPGPTYPSDPRTVDGFTSLPGGTGSSSAGGNGADLPGTRTSAAGFGTPGGPGLATTPLGSTSAAAAVPLGGLATGQDGRTSGAPVGWRQLVGNGRPGLLGDAAAGGRAGGPGATGFPGMGVPPAGNSRREEDAEHRNRLPSKHKLFTVDEKPFPPVLGV